MTQTDQLDETVLLSVLADLERGDFSVRMPLEWTGVAGQIAGRLNTVIAANQAQAEALSGQALHDGLTGLANRRLLTEHLSQALASATRNHESRAILVIGLDRFKWINDSFGHDQGDRLLKQFADRLVAATRESDTIARLGGDEFSILLGDAADLPAAAGVVWKLQQVFAGEFELDQQDVRASASIGIAMFPEHGNTPAELLRRADAAMHEAKKSGTGYAVADNALEELATQQLEALLELRKCVSRSELILHYQPKFQLGSGAICGVEALVRWRHPDRGLLLPEMFMADVERTELLGQLTQWVLNEALRQQRVWGDSGIDLTMAVNVSARSLTDRTTLVGSLEQAKEAWETKPDRLILELTESAVTESEAPRLLGRIHDMGIKLSIDDFGTGYSSLSYLQRLPVDEIKIDQSFVTSLANHDEDDQVIVRSTIELAHNLGLTVVAEGVEDDVALDIVSNYGCDRAQGYFLGRPCPAEELTPRLIAAGILQAGSV
jgi:diguanylate cyclase (GGDEF)-like protein